MNTNANLAYYTVRLHHMLDNEHYEMVKRMEFYRFLILDETREARL